MPAPSSFYPRIFALVVAVVLGYALILIFAPFLGPMAWAAFLAFLLYPLNLRLRRRLPGRGISAGVLTILAPITILLPLSALSIDFVAQISALMQRVQKSAAELDIKSLSDLQQFPWIARINVWLEAHAGISAEQVQSWLVSGTREVLQRAASMGGGFFLGALGSLLGFAIMLFLLFFFLRDGDAMLARARRLIPLDEERKERLFRQLSGVTRAIVVGTSVTALFQGAFGRHRFHDCRLTLTGRVRRAGGPALDAAGGWDGASSGVRPRSGCLSTAAGVLAYSWSRWGLSARRSGQRPAADAHLRPGANFGAGGVHRRSGRHSGVRVRSASSRARWCCPWRLP